MQEKKDWKKELAGWVKSIIIVLLCAVILRSFVFCTARVRGISMEPLFLHGDIAFAELISYRLSDPELGDIVVCKYDKAKGSETLIKRVIGSPGDIIDIYRDADNECIITINGEELEEPYLFEPMVQKGDITYPITLAEDEFFLMGDNRNSSADSRDKLIGPIKEENIIGRVRLRIWPLDRISIID